MTVGKVVRCDYCKGTGTVTVWNNRKKTYETVTCTVCRGTGRVDLGTI